MSFLSHEDCVRESTTLCVMKDSTIFQTSLILQSCGEKWILKWEKVSKYYVPNEFDSAIQSREMNTEIQLLFSLLPMYYVISPCKWTMCTKLHHFSFLVPSLVTLHHESYPYTVGDTSMSASCKLQHVGKTTVLNLLFELHSSALYFFTFIIFCRNLWV